MPDDANDIMKQLKKGELPPIKTDTSSSKNSGNSSGNGTTSSQRGLDNSEFGLQSLNEGKSPKKSKN